MTHWAFWGETRKEQIIAPLWKELSQFDYRRKSSNGAMPLGNLNRQWDQKWGVYVKELQSVPFNWSILIKCVRKMICRAEDAVGQNSLRHFALPILIKIKKKTDPRDKVTEARYFWIHKLLEYFLKEIMWPPIFLHMKKILSSKLPHLVW